MRTLPTVRSSPGTFVATDSAMPSSGWMRSTSTFGSISWQTSSRPNRQYGICWKWIDTSVVRRASALAGADVERHALPAPVVDEQLQRDVGRRARVRRRRPRPRGSPRYWPRTASSGESARTERSSFSFSSRTSSAPKVAGSSIADEREHLQQVVLHHVAHDAGRVVELPAPLDADLLGHRDLHVVDVLAVPQRLEDRVAEAEHQDVLDRLLAEVVVDAEALALVEDARPPGRCSARAESRSRPNGFSITTRDQGAAVRRLDQRRFAQPRRGSARTRPAARRGRRAGCRRCRAPARPRRTLRAAAPSPRASLTSATAVSIERREARPRRPGRAAACASAPRPPRAAARRYASRRRRPTCSSPTRANGGGSSPPRARL